MSGRSPFRELTRDFSPERNRRIELETAQLLAEMPLHELRLARQLTQNELAKKLSVNQPAIAKMERRADMYVSSLRSYVEAMGGKLTIVAEFPEGYVPITNFSSVGTDEGEAAGEGPVPYP